MLQELLEERRWWFLGEILANLEMVAGEGLAAEPASLLKVAQTGKREKIKGKKQFDRKNWKSK